MLYRGAVGRCSLFIVILAYGEIYLKLLLQLSLKIRLLLGFAQNHEKRLRIITRFSQL